MNRQQKWAESAFANVTSVHGKKAVEAKYRTYALKFPSLLLQSGLVQAATFTHSRDETGAAFIKHLAETMGSKDLLADARKAALADYLRLASDALAVGAWYRRFAQAELEGEAD